MSPKKKAGDGRKRRGEGNGGGNRKRIGYFRDVKLPIDRVFHKHTVIISENRDFFKYFSEI